MNIFDMAAFLEIMLSNNVNSDVTLMRYEIRRPSNSTTAFGN